MAMEFIMVDGGALAHGPGSTITGGTFVIVTNPSLVDKLQNKGIYMSTLGYSFSGGSAPGVVAGTVRTIVNQKIDPSAVYVNVEGENVIRQGDSGTMNAIGDNPSPPPATLPVTGPVTVAIPGQNKGKGK